MVTNNVFSFMGEDTEDIARNYGTATAAVAEAPVKVAARETDPCLREAVQISDEAYASGRY